MHSFNRAKTWQKALLIIILSLVLVYFVRIAYVLLLDSNTFKGGTRYAGISVENLSSDDAARVLEKHLTNVNVQIISDGLDYSSPVSHYGITLSHDAIASALRQQKLRYAFLPFWYNKNYQLLVESDEFVIANHLQAITLPNPNAAPQNARIQLLGSKPIVLPERAGLGIDPNVILPEIVSKLQSDTIPQSITITTSLRQIQPVISKQALQNKLFDIEQILQQTYILSYQNSVKSTLPIGIIAESLSIDKSGSIILPYPAAITIIEQTAKPFTTEPIPELVYSYTDNRPNRIFQTGQVGNNVANSEDLARQLQSSVASKTPYSGEIMLTDEAYKTQVYNLPETSARLLRYRIETWGTTRTPVYDFRQKAAETLLSELGWARADVVFEEVNVNEDFTLVLSEGAELARRYAPTCDAFYSCRVGNNVIINDSRWQEATPVWTKTIRDYQHLVINHEVGHLLGHGHYFCAKPGDPAPAMQQQSIELRGCTFNEWPLQFEIDAI